MLDPVLEALPAALELVLVTVGTGVLTLFGAYLDLRALQSFQAGEAGAAPVFLYFGTLALFAGAYMLGYRELLPRVRRLADRA